MPSGVDGEGGREEAAVARRVGKAGRKSEGRPPSLLSSISDKNKVNGEWGCRKGGCCSAGARRGELLRTGRREGLMLLRPGRIKAKGEKAKSTTIDATGHAEYNEDAPLRFPVSPLANPRLSRLQICMFEKSFDLYIPKIDEILHVT